MKDPRTWKWRLAILAVVLVVAAVLVGLSLTDDGREEQAPARSHPILFGAPQPCSGDGQPARRARRAARQAHFHAERYPYDPRDGVQAVLLFEKARSCYQESGLRDQATRVDYLASDLAARINVDYASSRLVLESALASEKWGVALVELRRLLRLTEHVRGHAYVAYLWSILGKVTLLADDAG